MVVWVSTMLKVMESASGTTDDKIALFAFQNRRYSKTVWNTAIPENLETYVDDIIGRGQLEESEVSTSKI